MTWVIENELGNDLEGLTSVKKCDSQGTPESCEYIVKNLKFTKICEKMTMKNQFWSSFVDGVKPQLECPLKPATYTVEIFLNDVFKYFFAVPTGVWKTQMSYLMQNEVISCVNIDFKVYEREF
ncbi:hypothetical protein WA026_005634 [Henosepilachna vigintioctopunctata]|uniref:Uncharacterized protein n=1 Tax=Henosepilachna vigintioctopunctata TaxID=420089 RepID=A0AAW1TWZ3_9CUCU